MGAFGTATEITTHHLWDSPVHLTNRRHDRNGEGGAVGIPERDIQAYRCLQHRFTSVPASKMHSQLEPQQSKGSSVAELKFIRGTPPSG